MVSYVSFDLKRIWSIRFLSVFSIKLLRLKCLPPDLVEVDVDSFAVNFGVTGSVVTNSVAVANFVVVVKLAVVAVGSYLMVNF